MECGQCFPSQPLVVLTVHQFVAHGSGPLERQKQDSHVYQKTGTFPLIFRKDQSRHYINDEVWETVKKVRSSRRVMNVKMNTTSNYVSSFQTDDRSGTFKCARSRCKTCPFIHNVENISGTKRSIKITDHFTCTSANVIYCITCTYCNKLYIGETGRLLGDRFREHLAAWKEMTRTHRTSR